MAITFVGAASGTDTATMPAHQADDFIIVFAYRDGSATAPTPPTGYTHSPYTGTSSGTGGNTNSSVIGHKYAINSSEVVGTWTNATSVLVHVYRGVHLTDPVIRQGDDGSSGATLNWSYTGGTGSSRWLLLFGGSRAASLTAHTTPPTPFAGTFTNRSGTADATDTAAGHDSNGNAITVSATLSSNWGGANTGWRSRDVLLRPADERSYWFPRKTFSRNIF